MKRIFPRRALGFACGRRRRSLPWASCRRGSGREAEDALDEVGLDEVGLDEVGLDELAAHLRLLLPEKDAVGPEDGAAAGLGLEALQDVLLEGVVGAALRRDAEEMSMPPVPQAGS